MKTKSLQMKRALRSVLLILLLSAVGMGKGYAYDFSAVCSTGQTLYYNIIDVSNHYAALTHPGIGNSGNNYNYWSGYSKPTGNIILPESVQYGGTIYTITSIDDNAFRSCNDLTGSLLIPNSVVSIGSSAFYYCGNFNGLTIGNFVNTIGTNAFAYCSGLMSINIPNSVNSIGLQAFNGTGWYNNQPVGILYLSDCCLGYKGNLSGELSIQDGTRLICNGAFQYCHNLTGNLVIPNSVTTIGSGAFQSCNNITGNLVIPNSVTTIGDYAFKNCSGFTGSLIIGNSVASIGESAFQDCSGFTGTLYIGNSVESLDNTLFNGCNGFNEVHYNAINCADAEFNTSPPLSNPPFYGWQGTLTIGSDVERIPASMFRDAAFSGSLNIPNSVNEIGNKAFSGCSGFTGSLTIPNSVTTIGYHAFYNCSGFTGSLTIGNSVNEIGDSAFSGCSGFTGSLTIPNSVTTIGDYAFCNCSGFTGSLTIGNSVNEIGNNAFSGCSGFTGSLTIPDAVTSIGGYAFYNCSSFIGGLNIGNSVTTIGSSAFYNCSGFIGSLTIPNSVTSMGSYAFYSCYGITIVDYYADNCSLMGENAFNNCSITTVNIGENVQSIPQNAFNNCPTLNIIIAMGTTPPILGNNAFSGISPVAILFVPCGSLMAYFSNWNIFEYNNIHEDCTPRPVSISPNITGGTIIPSVSQASMGQEVMLAIIPNPGLQLVSISAYNTNNPSQIVPISPIGDSYRFAMPPYAVTVSATFETYELLEENDVVTAEVYPNPTTGSVKIEAEDIHHIRINNMLGQFIYESVASGNEFEYDFSKHGKGIYLIHIETASGVVTKRVVVTR